MGLSMPAVYHDDAAGFDDVKQRVPFAEAWNQIRAAAWDTLNLSGRMKQYTDMADVNMGGIIEMVLNNGVSRRIAGKQVSIQTGDPRDFRTLDDLNAVKAQIDYFVDVIVAGNQLLIYLSTNYRPVPALSLGYPNCVETMKDYKYGRAKYNCGGGARHHGRAGGYYQFRGCCANI